MNKATKSQDNRTRDSRKSTLIAAVVSISAIALLSMMMFLAHSTTIHNAAIATEAARVIGSWDKQDRATIASTSVGGYQGDIIDVKAGSSRGAIVVTVSTYFNDPGTENNGGKNIAQKILSMLCTERIEVDSLYVTSTSSGMDSQSVYRSSTGSCRQ